MRIRRRRTSKAERLRAAAVTYLKLKALTAAFKGAGKTVKGAAAYKAAKEAPAPVKALPIVAGLGVGVAGAVAVSKRRGADSAVSPTPATPAAA
jgi:hypothetical protein